MIHTLYKCFLISLVFSFMACDSDKPTDNPDQRELDDLCIITGVQFKDANGQLIGKAGNPNIRTEQTLFYPIPGDGNMIVQSQSTIEKVWLIPAEKSLEFQDVNYASQNIIYDATALDEKSTMNWDSSGDILALNLSATATGFYRVVCLSANGNISFDNIYLDPSKTSNEIYEFLIEEW